MKAVKLTVRAVFYLLLAFAGAAATVNLWIGYKTEDFIFADVSALPAYNTGLLLGTAPFQKSGKSNPFFENRIAAAAELYGKGKIRNIIASGDNRSPYYNEPEEMRRRLVKMGVPNDRIYLDCAGLRTLDSVVRCGEIFGQTGFTIISQRFHNQRAVFLARGRGFDAVGYSAKDVDYRESFKTRFREYLARLGAVADLIICKEPRLHGEKVKIAG